MKKSLLDWFLIMVAAPAMLTVAIMYLGPIIRARVENVQSYTGRGERLREAWQFLGDLSVAPITMSREFTSPHMFIFDSYYSGGVFALFFSSLLVWRVLIAGLPSVTIGLEPRRMSFVFAIPLLVRLFTAGSGLPGIGATLAYSVALALKSVKRARDI